MDGIIISPQFMLDGVLSGQKKHVAKTRPFNLEGKDLYLINKRNAFGIVHFGQMQKLSKAQLLGKSKSTLIDREILGEWCDKQESWCEGPYYVWPVKLKQKYKKPKATNVQEGAQVIAKDVRIRKKILIMPS